MFYFAETVVIVTQEFQSQTSSVNQLFESKTLYIHREETQYCEPGGNTSEGLVETVTPIETVLKEISIGSGTVYYV